MPPTNKGIQHHSKNSKRHEEAPDAPDPSHTNPAADCVAHTNLHLVVRLDGDCDRLLLAGEEGGRHFESSAAGTWNRNAWTYAVSKHIFGTPWIF